MFYQMGLNDRKIRNWRFWTVLRKRTYLLKHHEVWTLSVEWLDCVGVNQYFTWTWKWGMCKHHSAFNRIWSLLLVQCLLCYDAPFLPKALVTFPRFEAPDVILGNPGEIEFRGDPWLIRLGTVQGDPGWSLAGPGPDVFKCLIQPAISPDEQSGIHPAVECWSLTSNIAILLIWNGEKCDRTWF